MTPTPDDSIRPPAKARQPGAVGTYDLAGVRLPVATPEDLVVFKAVAWRDRDRGAVEWLEAAE
jgi:hypothetical protein